jgi:hypothetical protein
VALTSGAHPLWYDAQYTGLTPLTKTSALLTYNRFFHPGNGVDGCSKSPEYPCGTAFSMRIDLRTRELPPGYDGSLRVCPPPRAAAGGGALPTLQAALQSIRSYRDAGDRRPAMITLCAGEHQMAQTMHLDASDSNLAFRGDARGGATATLTARIEISGRAPAATTGSAEGPGVSSPLWKAKLPASVDSFRQLWGSDGSRRKRATLEGSAEGCGVASDWKSSGYAVGCHAFQLPNGGGVLNLTAELTAEGHGRFPGFTANSSWPAAWRHSDVVRLPRYCA